MTKVRCSRCGFRHCRKQKCTRRVKPERHIGTINFGSLYPMPKLENIPFYSAACRLVGEYLHKTTFSREAIFAREARVINRIRSCLDEDKDYINKMIAGEAIAISRISG